MLSEAELQELRGMAFDRLLLRLWPKRNPNRLGKCVSCDCTDGTIQRGLCRACYGRWRRGTIPASVALPPRLSGWQQYTDSLLAKRVGLSLKTMRDWRSGKQLPRYSTVLFAAPRLEEEFGAPGAMWVEAAAVSYHAIGCTLSRYGNGYTRRVCIPQTREDPTGQQYGYWLVIRVVRVVAVADPQYRSTRVFVAAKCLLCGSLHEKSLYHLRADGGTRCSSCAQRIRRSGRGISGFKGVRKYSATGKWRVEDVAPSRTFNDPVEAARYYDSCMYERYGHTLFLNFPDEYDRSNDPVFVPVKRIGDS